MRVRLRNGGVNQNTVIDKWAMSDLTKLRHAVGSKDDWWKQNRAYFKSSVNSVYESIYVHHLYRWLGKYERSRFLLFYSVDFFKDPADVTGKVLQFIGLDASQVDLNSAVKEVCSTTKGPNPTHASASACEPSL